MYYPHCFTRLGFKINALIDKGVFLESEKTFKLMEKRQIIDFLEKEYEPQIMDIYTAKEREEFLNYFESSANANIPEDFGCEKNGLCFLLALILEMLQSGVRQPGSWFTTIEINRDDLNL